MSSLGKVCYGQQIHYSELIPPVSGASLNVLPLVLDDVAKTVLPEVNNTVEIGSGVLRFKDIHSVDCKLSDQLDTVKIAIGAAGDITFQNDNTVQKTAYIWSTKAGDQSSTFSARIADNLSAFKGDFVFYVEDPGVAVPFDLTVSVTDDSPALLPLRGIVVYDGVVGGGLSSTTPSLGNGGVVFTSGDPVVGTFEYIQNNGSVGRINLHYSWLDSASGRQHNANATFAVPSPGGANVNEVLFRVSGISTNFGLSSRIRIREVMDS